jgi:hypothetical protein
MLNHANLIVEELEWLRSPCGQAAVDRLIHQMLYDDDKVVELRR